MGPSPGTGGAQQRAYAERHLARVVWMSHDIVGSGLERADRADRVATTRERQNRHAVLPAAAFEIERLGPIEIEQDHIAAVRAQRPLTLDHGAHRQALGEERGADLVAAVPGEAQ